MQLVYRRFRGSKKRIERIRWGPWDKWLAVAISLFALLAITAGAWLGYHYSDF